MPQTASGVLEHNSGLGRETSSPPLPARSPSFQRRANDASAERISDVCKPSGVRHPANSSYATRSPDTLLLTVHYDGVVVHHWSDEGRLTRYQLFVDEVSSAEGCS